MASATVIERADHRVRRRFWPASRLGRLIIALNLLGLAILVAGALILNELRRGLVQARIDDLTTQGELIANVIAQAATSGSPEPRLDSARASDIIQFLFIPSSQRARLFDVRGNMLADTYLLGDRVEWRRLPPAKKRGAITLQWGFQDKDATDPVKIQAARAALRREISQALRGNQVSGVRTAQNGDRVVSVSIPIQRVQAVLGVLTLEAGDVDKIVAAQRRALMPFILVAVGVTLLSSGLLTWMIARPVIRLAGAADRVRLQQAREISLPSISRRDDELGDLARALQAMTATLSERMDAIERFAADVAHEIRNPLTSIRSAVETLTLVKEPAQRDRLMRILMQDVGRLDRLITDISNASRLDAELSRDRPRAIDLARLLPEMVTLYRDSSRPDQPAIVYAGPEFGEAVHVVGREGPLSQVFRNLIDNARSFSPPGATVTVSLGRSGPDAVVEVQDEGPGIPPDNLETVFQRFYTSRPKGAEFGSHSGLGLSIARQIVQAHGGRIKAANHAAPDGRVLGARFLVLLPEARA
jgi:two-component system sensor histidine kinase ChvG